MWAQDFNLYFNISEDLSRNPDTVLNGTLRLYKNYSLPLIHPSMVEVKLHSYSKVLTKRRGTFILC